MGWSIGKRCIFNHDAVYTWAYATGTVLARLKCRPSYSNGRKIYARKGVVGAFFLGVSEERYAMLLHPLYFTWCISSWFARQESRKRLQSYGPSTTAVPNTWTWLESGLAHRCLAKRATRFGVLPSAWRLAYCLYDVWSTNVMLKLGFEIEANIINGSKRQLKWFRTCSCVW